MTRRPALFTLALTAALAVGALPATAQEPPEAPSPPTLADRIVEVADGGASTPSDLAEALNLPVDGPGSLVADASGVAATVTFETRPTPADLAAVAELATIDRVYRFSPAVSVTVHPSGLDALATLDGVRSVTPVVRGTTAGASAIEGTLLPTAPDAPSCRSIPVEADGPLGSADARGTFDVDGSGVTVGIISDSFGLTTDVTNPAQDVAAGLLPGPGNPCGFETPVSVLVEADEGADEGRAMAQLVHGVAPGAELLFATGWGGPLAMVEAIYTLAMAGADVIVDDLGYATETYFQQGLISVAIADVRSQGIAYYSSAGNGNIVGAAGGPSEGLPIASWQTDAYRATDCPSWVWVPDSVTEYDCLDFDPSSAEDPVHLVGLNGDTSPQFLLSWGEPINGVESAFSLQLYSDDPEPLLYNIGTTYDADIPNEMLAFGITPPEGTYRLVLVRDLTDRVPNDPALWIGTFSGGYAIDWREYDTSVGADVVGPVSFGHPADGSAVGVAAVDWADPGVPESFTSPGPARLLFEPFDPLSGAPSPAYPEPVVVRSPHLAGVDGTRTSFFGGPDEFRFYGTSAAAPHVAAVHALAADYAPGLDAESIVAALAATAGPLTNPHAGVLDDDTVFGAGLANAFALLGALPAPGVEGLTAGPESASRISAEWQAVPGASGYRAELRLDGELSDASDGIATEVSFGDLEPATAYEVRVAARNADGDLGPWSSATVETPALVPPDEIPDPPPASNLTPGEVTALQSSAGANDEVSFAGLPPEQWAGVWLFSTPRFLGWVRVGGDGIATFTLPADVAPGDHRVAFVDADGGLLGSAALVVTGTAPSALAVSGADTPPLVAAAALLLLAGAVAAVTARSRRAVFRRDVERVPLV